MTTTPKAGQGSPPKASQVEPPKKRGGRRPGAGRKAAGEAPRVANLALKLTRAELAHLEALAHAEGVPVATWAYRALRAALDAAGEAPPLDA